MNVLALLLVIVVASGVAGLGRSRHMLWGVTGVAGLILVAFVGLSAYARFLTRPARRRPRRSFGRTAPRRSADGSGRYAEEVEPYGQGGEADGWYQQGDRTVEAWDDADTGDGSPQPDGGFWVDDGEIWDEQARTEQIRTEQILYRFDDVQGRDDEGEGWEPIAAAR